MPQISVIVPVYKVEPYLCRCVDSILGQSFSDFKLILVDDGSPDNCPAICDEYAAQDGRIHVIHQKNSGLSAARNAGIDWAFANSDSQWLTFIDSDDWVHPEYLHRLLNAAIDNGVDVSICGYVQTAGEEPIITTADLQPAIWSPEAFWVEQNINATIACGKLYKKECFQTLRYPIGKLHEDEFTTYKILFSYNKISVVDVPLYYYFKNPTGITHSRWSPKRLVAYDALEEQIQFFDDHNFHRAQRNVMRRYLKSIHDKIDECSKYPHKNSEALIFLKQRKRQNFKNYAKQLDPNDDVDAWVLSEVFPLQMALYWHIRALLCKLRIK